MKRAIFALLPLIALFSLFACAETPVAGESAQVDALGRPFTISAEDRVAACHASFADCWLLAGGELVGVTADAIEDHGLEVGDAAVVGTAKTVDLEALVASKATVVLLSADLTAHRELEPTLSSLGIRCAYFRVDTFADYDALMALFCSVTDRADLYDRHVLEVGARIEAIRAQIPTEETRSVLLMRVYSSGIKAKRDDNLAGQILKEFGLVNVADAAPSMLEDMGLEHIVATDPDYIFVLTMGSEEAAKSYLEANLESNPAFAALKAVQNGNYILLPKALFHYKPNESWDQSYEFLAEILYPEIFGR
ncbi:MAG: ABC transporter substrate-binding protein [Clostridia bacterium]|nr:ABC transporter substrate-binding protein [Clostridia bacterium]